MPTSCGSYVERITPVFNKTFGENNRKVDTLKLKRNRTVSAENAIETKDGSTVNKQIPNILNLKDEKNSCSYSNKHHNINVVQQRQ